MTSDQQFGKQNRNLICAQDLEQVRQALSDLRALRSYSALADLAEEKIRAMEDDVLMRDRGFGPSRTRRNLS
jgi:hypothetical protein